MDSNYSLWHKYLSDKQARTSMSLPLQQNWEESMNKGIDPFNAKPHVLTDDEFEEIKRRTETLYSYAHDNLAMAASHLQNSNQGIILLDKNATVLRLYGGPIFHEWAKVNQIRIKTSWALECIGATAISVGMYSHQSFRSIGAENYSQFARNFSITYSPVLYGDIKGEKVLNGGIAIIGPADQVMDNSLMTAEAIAHNIDQHYFWIDMVNFMSDRGTLVVEQNTPRHKIHLINTQVFDALHIPFQDLINHSLEELFTYEDNKEFWEKFKLRHELEDTDVVLYVDGMPRDVTMSMRSFENKSFRIDGTLITLNSRKRTHKVVSKYTSTNAFYTFEHIIGKDTIFLKSLYNAKNIAGYDSNVLIMGESGVGKDLIAQSIHNASSRKGKPFIAINCAALPRELIASELFGYDDGTFTGGKKGGKIGKFELANQGTIFLDEIGDMPLDLQSTLLRILEERSFIRLGGERYIPIDVRVIAATNVDLKEKIQRNTFRKDLFFRLGTVRLQIPPLRERKGDILLLGNYFIKKFCAKNDRKIPEITQDAKAFLLEYDWPGNIRELQSLFESILQIYNEPAITLQHIQSYFGTDLDIDIDLTVENRFDLTLEESNETEQQLIYNTLISNRFNQTKTAQALGISRRTLYRKLKKYNLT